MNIGPHNNNRILLILFVLFFLYSALVTIPTSSFMVDEGWAADIGNSLLEGKTLYKNMSAPYGPITFYIYALAIYFFGKQFIVFRIIGTFIIILQAYLSYRIVRQIIGNSYFTILTPLLVLVSIGSYQGDRITASTLAGLFSIFIIYFHITYIKTKRKHNLAFIGIFLVLSLLTKHNVFAFDAVANGIVILGSTLSRVIRKREIDYQYLFLVPFFFLLFLTPYILMIYPYYNSILENTLFQISDYSSSMRIPFPNPLEIPGMNRREVQNSLFHYSIFPIVLSFIIIALKLLKGKGLEREIWLVFSVVIFQYLQVFPLSDYSHYVRASIVYPILIVPLLNMAWKMDKRMSFHLLVFGLILHLYIVPIHQVHYLRKLLHASVSNLPYNRNILEIREETVIFDILGYIKKFGDGNIIVVGHHNYLYYLSSKSHISQFSLISHHYLNSVVDEHTVISEIEMNKVAIVIEGPPLRKVRDLDVMMVLGEYVRDNFNLCRTINGYNIWCR